MSSSSNGYYYLCSICGSIYNPFPNIYVCPEDGGNLDICLDYEAIKRSLRIEDITLNKEMSLWRYLPILPVEDPGWHGTPIRSAGWTPTYRNTALAETLGIKDLCIKDEGRNPTASFKDRASAVVIARANARK